MYTHVSTEHVWQADTVMIACKRSSIKTNDTHDEFTHESTSVPHLVYFYVAGGNTTQDLRASRLIRALLHRDLRFAHATVDIKPGVQGVQAGGVDFCRTGVRLPCACAGTRQPLGPCRACRTEQHRGSSSQDAGKIYEDSQMQTNLRCWSTLPRAKQQGVDARRRKRTPGRTAWNVGASAHSWPRLVTVSEPCIVTPVCVDTTSQPVRCPNLLIYIL